MGSFRKFRNPAELPLPFSSFRSVQLVISPYSYRICRRELRLPIRNSTRKIAGRTESVGSSVSRSAPQPERSPDGAGSYRICRRELRLPIPDLARSPIWPDPRSGPIPDLARCLVVERVSLASFGRSRVLVSRPPNPYSFTLASFGNFPVMIMSANLVASLPVASFVTFQIEMADRNPSPKYFISAYYLRESPEIIYDAVTESLRLSQFFYRSQSGQSI
jgi:hypothetical protein